MLLDSMSVHTLSAFYFKTDGVLTLRKTGAILASIYCDKADRETYAEIFQTLFEQVESITGKKLLIFAIHGKGIRAVLTDCEVPETQGLGDALIVVNKAYPDSPLWDIDDPLTLVKYVGKLCKTHFHR